MVIIAPSSPVSSDSDTEMGGKRGFCRCLPRIVIAAPSSPVIAPPSSPVSSYSDTESGRKIMLEFLEVLRTSDLISLIRHELLRVLSALVLELAGVESICLDPETGTCEFVGSSVDAIRVMHTQKKSVAFATFPTSVSITELQPNKDTDLERKRSVGMLISEEQQEQSEKQQEDQPPPGQADCYISQVKASLLSHPLPSMSLPLASEARPSPSPVSPPSQGMSYQMQATPDHVSEFSFPFATSSLPISRTKSLADMPAHSSISGGACLPRDMELMEEEEGPGGHDQLNDSVVHNLLSGINGIGELKRHYDLHAGEQVTRPKEAEDTTIMLRERVKELEAKLSMANTMERCLREMLLISEHRHAEIERELALMRENKGAHDRRLILVQNVFWSKKTHSG